MNRSRTVLANRSKCERSISHLLERSAEFEVGEGLWWRMGVLEVEVLIR